MFDLILQLNGYPILKAKKRLQEIQRIPEKDYEAYIHKQRLRIVNYHLKNNSVYKSIAGKDKFDRWDDIPIMTKRDLQKPLK